MQVQLAVCVSHMQRPRVASSKHATCFCIGLFVPAQVKALTACFWSDFMLNPNIMYGLFANTPFKLTYDQDRVKVMGTEAGMIK